MKKLTNDNMNYIASGKYKDSIYNRLLLNIL